MECWLEMNSLRKLIAFGLLVLALGTSSAEAAKRVALVIGNNSYKTLPDLNNVREDARGMATKLRELGFDVILKQNTSRRVTVSRLMVLTTWFRPMHG